MLSVPRNHYYLGRQVDPATGRANDQPLFYDQNDLTTHAVVVGMTGSGKTGLCLDLLEEAALQNIPALMIDPKGDITNALLHFPDLAPADFQPWINADDAQRAGKSVAQAAADTAVMWKNGLAEWGIEPERIQALKDSVRFAIYTPGSDAGIPISILSSFARPSIPWQGNQELLRERISSTVTAVLGLIGLTNLDPVRSREHILLANILEYAWSNGQDLTLDELIMQTQTPPFPKLGVFDVNRFFPEKDRFELAISLNNILAAPAFQTWIQGQALDVQSLLYTSDGQPRHSIFYIAHLNDEERMFFVTLLFGAVETWMRSQAGTGSLRALLYFDEIFGYMPPTANPPSKELMLRLLKQARAFGLGLVLASQNPVDIDYKGLSNAGTWFIGKLGTDQDKQRLLDGLESIVAGGLDRGDYDRLISGLGKRVFLLRNVHDKEPGLFQTRWAMNYLAGPMTRTQIAPLNALVGAGAALAAPTRMPAAASMPTEAPVTAAPPPAMPASVLPGTATRPAVPSAIAEFFLPNNVTLSVVLNQARSSVGPDAQALGMLYRPFLLAQSVARVQNARYNVQAEMTHAALVPEPDPRGLIRWEEYNEPPVAERSLDSRPLPEAVFADLPGALSDSKAINGWQRDFVDWVYRTGSVTIRANEELKVYAGPEVSEADFLQMCRTAAAERASAEIDKLKSDHDKKADALNDKLSRAQRALAEDEAKYQQRKREEGVKFVENIIGLFGKGRGSLSTSMSKRRMTANAKMELESSQAEIEKLQQQIADLKDGLATATAAAQARWTDVAGQVGAVPLTPYKKDIAVTLFGVAWFPYHVVRSGVRTVELPAYVAAK